MKNLTIVMALNQCVYTWGLGHTDSDYWEYEYSIEFFEILKNYRNSCITVRKHVVQEAERQFCVCF